MKKFLRRTSNRYLKLGRKRKKKQKPILVNNISDLEKIKSKNVIIGKVGKKKRIEIAKKAKEMNLQITNINVEKLLKKSEKIKKNQNKK